MKTTIYHNPDCGTSRNTLALIRHMGIEPVIVEYLKAPPSRRQLLQLISQAKLRPREALREKETLYAELRLVDSGISDDDLLDAMLRHPVLINRPFVVTPHGTRLCRPAEIVLDILAPISQSFSEKNGEIVA